MLSDKKGTGEHGRTVMLKERSLKLRSFDVLLF